MVSGSNQTWKTGPSTTSSYFLIGSVVVKLFAFLFSATLRECPRPPGHSRLPAMALTAEERQLRVRFFKVLLEATVPLEPGPDCSNWSIGMPEPALLLPPGPSHEMTLEALIDAAQMLKEHLQGEPEKLRRRRANDHLEMDLEAADANGHSHSRTWETEKMNRQLPTPTIGPQPRRPEPPRPQPEPNPPEREPLHREHEPLHGEPEPFESDPEPYRPVPEPLEADSTVSQPSSTTALGL